MRGGRCDHLYLCVAYFLSCSKHLVGALFLYLDIIFDEFLLPTGSEHAVNMSRFGVCQTWVRHRL